jgi:hypothetical protein
MYVMDGHLYHLANIKQFSVSTARDSDPSVPPRISFYLVLVVIAAGMGFLYLSWLFITLLWSKCRCGISSKGPSSIEAGLQAGSVSGVSGTSPTSTDNLVEKAAPQAELRAGTP